MPAIASSAQRRIVQRCTARLQPQPVFNGNGAISNSVLLCGISAIDPIESFSPYRAGGYATLFILDKVEEQKFVDADMHKTLGATALTARGGTGALYDGTVWAAFTKHSCCVLLMRMLHAIGACCAHGLVASDLPGSSVRFKIYRKR